MPRAESREGRFARLVGGSAASGKRRPRKRSGVRNVVRGAAVGSRAITVKILDVTEFYSERGGGVRSHLATKGHVLCQLGHDHVVVAPGAEDGEAALAREVPRARVIRVRGPASPYDPTYHLFTRFDKIRAIVERERPDVLEIHSPYLAAAGALRARRGSFRVRTFQWHSDFIDTYSGVLEAKAGARVASLARPLSSPLWSLVRGIAKRCDATLVSSAWQVAKLTGHGVPRVIHRPFGIEKDVFRPDVRSADARRDLLAMCSRTEDTHVLVAVGRFAIEKRWDIVLDAFFELRARRDAILIVIGDGPERGRMKERIDRSAFARDVAFSGFLKGRSALAAVLASADALVHGCPHETFGLSIAEAMSCGLPAVVPDEGGAAEMHNPASGEQYRSEDVDACAAAIARILDRIDESGMTMRAAAASAASRLPSVEESFAHQVRLYEDLLSRGTRSQIHS
jgi:alpha-1,6-mannosyltransferase